MTKEALNFQKSLREKQGKCDAGSGGLRRKGVSQVGVRLPSLGHHWALVSPGEPRSPSLSASLFLRVPRYCCISDPGAGLPPDSCCCPWRYIDFCPYRNFSPGRWVAGHPSRVLRSWRGLLAAPTGLIRVEVLVRS